MIFRNSALAVTCGSLLARSAPRDLAAFVCLAIARRESSSAVSMQEAQARTYEESINSVVFFFFFLGVASGNAYMTEIETRNQIMLQGLSQTIDLTESAPFHFHMQNIHSTNLTQLIPW
ncbi:hypothetical protein ILYODFUR_010980 [Ilyodon furcidens]|uniref:Uncharacterized protein n=1 Tax=Ilyodon furcidens TaxID=33524 RepID=A0ABV0SK78_9TELE